MRPWREAWDDALYGPGGFFVREAPADHFATSVTASPVLAEAVRVLAGRVDDALGRPDPFDVVDLGAGRAELLQALPDVPARWRLTAVERAPSPALRGVRWLAEVPPTTGLLLAHEWLDAVPLDVLDGDRLVLVGADGGEEAGPLAPADVRAWADRWWPGGGRVEAGLARDRAWAAAVARVERGLAVAVDYGHARDDPRFGPRRPTLTGYRAGRAVRPVADGSCDVTAHVALDACAAATGARLLDQRTALRALGVDGRVPAEPTAAGLQRASAAARLLDRAGAGGFGWLVQEVGVTGTLPG